MLHTETVARETLGLLLNLMQDKRMAQFNLAGGTALALYLGHRISVDLDLFTPLDFDPSELELYLVEKYNFRGDALEKNTLKGEISGVRIDCITHAYPFVKEINVWEGVRLYDMEDIIAMKLAAVSDNGTRLKDFIDIAFLSTRFSFTEMLDAYERKFKNANKVRPIKGLAFYEDINFNEPILLLNKKYEWKKIQKRLQEMIKTPDKTFQEDPL